MGIKGLMLGLVFTVLYASGAVAMKFGLLSGPPLTLATIRFVIAGLMLFLYLYICHAENTECQIKKRCGNYVAWAC